MLKESVMKAFMFAKKAHEGQKRKFSNLDYFTHPKSVARYIEQLTKDETLVVVALLHDVVEDTKVTIEQIEKEFGERVSTLVFSLTNSKEEIKEVGKTNYLKLKMANMSDDALTVKLADRLHNVMFLEKDWVPLDFVYKYWKETKEILSYVSKIRKDKLHKALMNRIKSILKFLEIRHNFK